MSHRKSHRNLGLAIGLALATACATQQQMLQDKQAMAIDAATRRAQFEMSCTQTTATMLSSEMTQPVLEGPLVGGVERAEYTIGVAGCNQKKTFVVICPEDGNGCFAADPRVSQ